MPIAVIPEKNTIIVNTYSPIKLVSKKGNTSITKTGIKNNEHNNTIDKINAVLVCFKLRSSFCSLISCTKHLSIHKNYISKTR